MNKKIKIAYITTYDPMDIHQWSGAGTNILRTLKDIGFEIELIGSLKDKYALFFKLKKLFYQIVFSKNYLRDREPIVLKNYAKQIEKSLSQSNSDLVFSPGTIPISYLNTDKPIIFMTDATFGGMIGFYPSFSNLCSESIKHGNAMEQSALLKCSLALYESAWAAKTAIKHYQVNPDKVKIVPFGANIECDRTIQDIQSISMKKKFDTCKLLFIGAEWIRKGGEFSIKVAEILNNNGIQTELYMVGDKPNYKMPEFVKHFGFISRKTDQGKTLMDNLMKESHFLILPTTAEATPLVFAEACSFGLPSLTNRVGGTTEAIKDGVNGQTFNLTDKPEKYANYVKKLMSSKEEYHKMSLTAYQVYSDKLNWNSSGKKILKLVNELQQSRV